MSDNIEHTYKSLFARNSLTDTLRYVMYIAMHNIYITFISLFALFSTFIIRCSAVPEDQPPIFTLNTGKFLLVHLDYGSKGKEQTFKVFDNSSTVSAATCTFPEIKELYQQPFPASEQTADHKCQPSTYQWAFSNYISAKNFVIKISHAIELKDKQKSVKIKGGSLSFICATLDNAGCTADNWEIATVEYAAKPGWKGDKVS